MKKCQDLIKQVKDVCRAPDLIQAVTTYDQLSSFNKSLSVLDTIENSLKEFKFQRA